MIAERLPGPGVVWVICWLLAASSVMALPSTVLPRDLPEDAWPVDAWQGRVLLASGEGLLELRSSQNVWQVERIWRTGHELPVQFFGLARYLPDGAVAVVVGGQVLRVGENGGVDPWLSLAPQRHAHHLWVGPSGDLWIAYQPTPTASEVLLQRWQANDASPELRHELHWSSAATVSDGCVDGAGDLWLATTGGLLQVSRDGGLMRQDVGRFHAVVCGCDGVLDLPTGGELVELDRVGRAVRREEALPRLGQPIQAQRLHAEDDGEIVGAVLFSSGRLAWWRRDAAGRLLAGGLMEVDEVFPEFARSMLWEPSSERLLVGFRDGLQVLAVSEILGSREAE